MNFELYQDAAGEWRWKLVAANGLIVADSAEGYSSFSNVKRAANMVVREIKAGVTITVKDAKK